MMYRYWAILAVLLLGLAACGGEEINAGEITVKAATALETVETFHFELTVSQGKAAPIDTPLGGVSIASAEGDFKRPQQLSGSLKAQLSDVPLPISMKVIILEGEAFLTNPLNPSQWEQVESEALDSFSPADGVAAVLRGLENPQFQGRETIDGAENYHISGSVQPATLAPLIGGETPAGTTLQIDVWIGVDDTLPRRLKIVGPLEPSEPQDIQRTLVLADFGKDVTIERPK